MATLVILASTGDVCGTITRIQEYNLDPYHAENDWERIGEQIRNAVYAATQIEEVEEKSSAELLKRAYEEGKRDAGKL
jgi:hypothetical protein